jgi:hypothetical protein
LLCDLKPNQPDTTVVPSLIQTKTKNESDPHVLKSQQDLADNGDAYGELHMGLRYRDGDGVEKDLDRARDLLQKAADQGDPDAAKALAKLPKPKKLSPPPDTSTNLAGITIQSAEYGMGKKVADVTDKVEQLLQAHPEGIDVFYKTLDADPLPGKHKQLTVKYDYMGTNHVIVVPGGRKLSVTMMIKNATK